MIEWKQVFDSLCGFVGGKKFFEISASVADYRLSFQGKLVGHYDTVNQAKAKAEELLTEWLTTANLIHRDSIYTCPECLDSGGVTSHYVGDYKKIIKDCPCLNNPNSIASIKRGGSDNGK